MDRLLFIMQLLLLILLVLYHCHNNDTLNFVSILANTSCVCVCARVYVCARVTMIDGKQIEITCRGQQLLPFLTLQHVRDNIWSTRDAVTTLLPDSSTTDHVMVLHYGRSAWKIKKKKKTKKKKPPKNAHNLIGSHMFYHC